MGLHRDLQSEIEKRRLPCGGWASGQGRRAAIETTCYGLIALADGQQSVRQNAIDFLLRTKNPDQSWPAFEGDDPEGCLGNVPLAHSTSFRPRAVTGDREIDSVATRQQRTRRSLAVEMEVPDSGSAGRV